MELTGNMLADSGMAAEQKIGGEGEQAINMSCMVNASAQASCWSCPLTWIMWASFMMGA